MKQLAKLRLDVDFGLSIPSASKLCAWSERTLWRKLASGQLLRYSRGGARADIAWSSLQAHLKFTLDADGLDLLRQADQGCILSQAELGLHLRHLRNHDCALRWLQLAAEAGQADAMHWVARSYLCGEGVAANRNLGVMWLARSAASGHAISDALLSSLSHPLLARQRSLSVVATATLG